VAPNDALVDDPGAPRLVPGEDGFGREVEDDRGRGDACSGGAHEQRPS
jgi:hypothetical protein